MENKIKRDTNFELLRIISMLMIVTIHYIMCDHSLYIEQGELKNAFFLFLYTVVSVSVNCFILISGYYLINSKFKIQKILRLWGLIIFYAIVTYVIYVITQNEILLSISTLDRIKLFTPIINGSYWFIKVYIALYMIYPFINKLIKSLNKKQFQFLLVILFVGLSVISTITIDVNYIEQSSGKSLIWFIFLYMIGAYISLYKNDTKLSDNKYKYLALYIILIVLEFLIKFILQCLYRQNIVLFNLADNFVVYNSIFILLASVFFFLFFKNLSINNKYINKAISTISPNVFAVYIIHENILIVPLLWGTSLNLKVSGTENYIIHWFISVICIFAICALIEQMRKWIFNALVKIAPFKNLKAYINNIYNNVNNKINEILE